MMKTMKTMKTICMALLSPLLAASPVHAAISVTDGSGATVTLARPAQRVETLAPFLHSDNDPYPVVLDGRGADLGQE